MWEERRATTFRPRPAAECDVGWGSSPIQRYSAGGALHREPSSKALAATLSDLRNRPLAPRVAFGVLHRRQDRC